MAAEKVIVREIEKELSSTEYACTALEPVTGGTGNFIFRGTLSTPLPDGTQEVIIKHGEAYIASNPSFQLPTSRCRAEEESLIALAKLPPSSTSSFSVRTPRLFYFNSETNTQVQEYLPNSLNLKAYALSSLVSNDECLKQPCFDLGKGIGLWLRRFHDWAKDEAQSKLQHKIKQNVPMQQLKNQINYSRLLAQVDSFPEILGEAKQAFEAVKKASEAELTDESKLQIIHGDFWTGNVILPNKQMSKNSQPTVFVIDWELAQMGVRPLDVGQMLGEMYELYLFKGVQAGLWLIQGLCAGYGIDDDEFAFRVAVHTGVHLVCWSNVPGWGTEKEVLKVLATGRDIIVRAWAEDRSWFLNSDLASIFQGH
ncbi:hypothetical protein VTK73DRAFT_5883 [Phialemonium thermophilum]|uniref:Aminoglycoside phosphotransferase domain-containing protein n=1 Tax=Phialemonium thermophilum TaxID=223376 RepID=A0ABR3XXX9_9PEZI